MTCGLTFPRRGTVLDGVTLEADATEVKWDIYIDELIFLIKASPTLAVYPAQSGRPGGASRRSDHRP